MNEQVLLPNGGEEVAVEIPYALRKASLIGGEFEVGPFDVADLGGVGEAEEALDLVGIAG